MALDVTIGGTASDSYSTLAEWETYAADFINQDITGHAHDTSHEANLRRAAAYLDRTYSWKGFITSETQSMQWPRIIHDSIEGYFIDSDEIPTQIKQAQMELAWLIHEGTDVFATLENGPLKKTKVKAGPVESENEYAGTRESAVFMVIEGMIKPYITGKRSASFSTVSVVRG